MSVQATNPAALESTSNSKGLNAPLRRNSSGKVWRSSKKRVCVEGADLMEFFSVNVPAIENPSFMRAAAGDSVKAAKSRSSSPLQRSVTAGVPSNHFGGLAGTSFRSEDSESCLALWEEPKQETTVVYSGESGWLKLGSQSPWRESVSNAVRKFESLSQAVVGNNNNNNNINNNNNKEKQLRSSWRTASSSSPLHPNNISSSSPRASFQDRASLKLVGGPRSPWRDLMTSSSSSSPSSSSPRRSSVNLAEGAGIPSTLSRLSPSCELNNANSNAAAAEAPKRAEFSIANDEKIRENKDEAADVATIAKAVTVVPSRQKLGGGSCTGTEWMVPVRMPAMGAEAGEEACRCKENKNCNLGGDDVVGSSSNKCSKEVRSEDETPLRASGAIPFAWEDKPGTPKTIAAAAERALSRKFSKNSVEDCVNRGDCSGPLKRSRSMDEALFGDCACELLQGGGGQQQAYPYSFYAGSLTPQPVSHRYYQQMNSLKTRCSSRCGSIDGVRDASGIDLVASSAAKFLEDEGCPSPALAPIKTAGSVPFQWEEAPGKPLKVDDQALTSECQSTLQLPPRLAAASNSRHSPLVGFYKKASPQHQVQRKVVRTPRMMVRTMEPATLMKSKSVGEARRSPFRKELEAANLANVVKRSNLLAAAGDSTNLPCSPTSILHGPDDCSQPSSSSNPSLSSECNLPLIAATPNSLSRSSSHSSLSFDSMENDSDLISPPSSLRSPLHVNKTRRDHGNNYEHDGTPESVKALLKICKSGSRWVKTKRQPPNKLGTIYSPEVWSQSPKPSAATKKSPGVVLLKQSLLQQKKKSPYVMPSVLSPSRAPNPDFSARLGGRFSPLKDRLVSRSDANVEPQFQFSSCASRILQDDMGDRSPAYTATLELLSPVHRTYTKRKVQAKPKVRAGRRSSRGFRLRTQFLVSICCYCTPF